MPAVQKIERVLGHNLNITESVIVSRVEQLIAEQLESAGVEILPLDVARVDWSRVTKDSTYRVPPFERGETEKRFRDLLVLESAVQLIEDSPSTPRHWRIALVTQDDQLTPAIERRTANHSNVRIVANLGDLKGLINTLVGEVGEEFVSEIQKIAILYFFEKENKETLYYRENVAGAIQTKFAGKLSAVPKDLAGKDLTNVWISVPRFSKKVKQRVHWITRITYEYQCYRWETPPMSEYLGSKYLGPWALIPKRD